jgi:hypothetical protein
MQIKLCLEEKQNKKSKEAINVILHSTMRIQIKLGHVEVNKTQDHQQQRNKLEKKLQMIPKDEERKK